MIAEQIGAASLPPTGSALQVLHRTPRIPRWAARGVPSILKQGKMFAGRCRPDTLFYARINTMSKIAPPINSFAVTNVMLTKMLTIRTIHISASFSFIIQRRRESGRQTLLNFAKHNSVVFFPQREGFLRRPAQGGSPPAGGEETCRVARQAQTHFLFVKENGFDPKESVASRLWFLLLLSPSK